MIRTWLLTALLLVGAGCTASVPVGTSGTASTSGATGAPASGSVTTQATPAPAVPASVSVFPQQSEINVPAPGGAAVRIPSTIQLVGTVHNTDGTITSDVLWSSENPRIARVEPTTGVVNSVLPDQTGTVVITAVSRLNPSLTATASVRVSDFGPAPSATPAPRKPVSVMVFPQTLTLNTPAEATASPAVRYPTSQQLVGTVFWSDGTLSSDVLWSTSNPLLLGVDASGSVRSLIPHATGSVQVNAVARADGTLLGSALVTVADLGPDPGPVPESTPVPKQVLVFPTSATLNTPPEATQSVSTRFPSSLRLQASVFLTDGTLSADVVWLSSNPLLVQVQSDGTATALVPHATGSVTIDAISRLAPDVVGTATLSIEDLGPQNPAPAPVTVASVSIFPQAVTLNTPYDATGSQPHAGFPTSFELEGYALLSDGLVSTDLLWSSSDLNVVSVTQGGVVSSVIARQTGQAVITVQSRTDPTQRATAVVTVVDNGRVNIDVR